MSNILIGNNGTREFVAPAIHVVKKPGKPSKAERKEEEKLNIPCLRHGVYKSPLRSDLEGRVKSWKKEWAPKVDVKISPILEPYENARNAVIKLLDAALERDELAPGHNFTDITNTVVDIKKFLNRLDRFHLDFVMRWPYVQMQVDEIASYLKDGYDISDDLVLLEKAIKESLVALRNGVYLKNSHIFVVRNHCLQPTNEQIKDLNKALVRLNDAEKDLDTTFFINLKPLKIDGYAYEGFGLIELTDKQFSADYIDDYYFTLAALIKHENAHLRRPIGVYPDAYFHKPEPHLHSPLQLTNDTCVTTALDELAARLTEFRFVFDQSSFPIDRFEAEKLAHQFYCATSALLEPDCFEAFTPLGTRLLLDLEERVRFLQGNIRHFSF